MRVKFVILIMSFILASDFAFADTIYLKSGKKIEGKIVRKTGMDVFVETPETTLFFSPDMIENIQENDIPHESFRTGTPKRKTYSWSEISNQVMYYYQNPDSEKLSPLLKFLLTLDNKSFWEFEEPRIRADATIHFFATVFQRNEYQIDKLKILLNESNDFQKKILNKIIFQAENYKAIEPVNAETFDLVWSEFFATGEREPILKLINVLGWKVTKGNPYKDPDLGILIWSLSANIRQHSLIKRICEEELKSRKGITKKRLREAIVYTPEIIKKKCAWETIKSILGSHAGRLRIGSFPERGGDWYDLTFGGKTNNAPKENEQTKGSEQVKELKGRN